jgi:hypothetical protein
VAKEVEAKKTGVISTNKKGVENLHKVDFGNLLYVEIVGSSIR